MQRLLVSCTPVGTDDEQRVILNVGRCGWQRKRGPSGEENELWTFLSGWTIGQQRQAMELLSFENVEV
jgi:hypothetical protein